MKKNRNLKSTTSVGKRVLGENHSKRVERGGVLYGYDQQKKRRNFSLTDTAFDILSKLAESKNLSRSELLEKAIRQGHLELVDCD